MKSQRSKNERELITNIIKVCKTFSSKECAEYIVHSLKFLENAFNKENFYREFCIFYSILICCHKKKLMKIII